MKTMKKVTFFIFGILALSNLPTHCFFYNDGRPSYALQGAAIGGIAGGRKGAGIGLAAGLGADVISNAAANDRRQYYDDGYYNKKYPRNKYYRSKPSYRNLRDENETLRQELEEMKRQQPQE